MFSLLVHTFHVQIDGKFSVNSATCRQSIQMMAIILILYSTAAKNEKNSQVLVYVP